MNPFDKLSDDPILHIFSYLRRNDLLDVSLVNGNFRRIVTESRATMIKIPLILDFRNPIAREVIAFALSRPFKALELKNIGNNIWGSYTALMEFLQNGNSVEYLNICSSLSITPASFQRIIDGFLPNLKACTIGGVHLLNTTFELNNNPPTPNTSLKYLRIIHDQHVKFFSGCTSIYSFEIATHTFPETDEVAADNIYKFLSQQKQLKRFKFRPTEMDLTRMVLPHLEHLILDCGDPDLADYIVKLPSLKSLQINIFDGFSINRIMRAISNAPKLESLDVWICCERLNTILMQFVNYNVKTLRIRDTFGTTTEWLLRSFLGVKLVTFDLRTRQDSIDKSYLLHPDMINKIEFEPSHLPLDIKFNPISAPLNVKDFESGILLFTKKFCKRIKRITVGHSTWLVNNSYTLHNAFCIDLLINLINVEWIELFSVQHYRELNYMLYRTRKQRKPLKNPQFWFIHRNRNEDRIKRICQR